MARMSRRLAKCLYFVSQDINGAPSEKHSFYNIWQKQAYRFVIQQLIFLIKRDGMLSEVEDHGTLKS